MAQRKTDPRPSSQPSALLMLSSEEMSYSLLGGLSDNVPSLLAIPQELSTTSTESASQLFITDEGDVDNFLGQTSSISTTPNTFSNVPPQKSSTISSFLPKPFSSPMLGTAHPPPSPASNQSPASSIYQSPTVYQNMPANVYHPPKETSTAISCQYRHVGKFQHTPPPPDFYRPPAERPRFGTPQQLPRQPPPVPQMAPQPPPPYCHPPRNPSVPSGASGPMMPYGDVYRPIQAHWFFAKDVDDDDVVWLPLSFGDSRKLEEAFSNGPSNNDSVAVEGGRYDVDIASRTKKSVYWQEKDAEVRRCLWFYRPEGKDDFVPYDEKFAAGLEESYRCAVLTSDFHKRLAFPSGETIIIHSPSAIVHFPASSQLDAWGNAMGDSRPQVVRRGVSEFENVPKDDPDKVDHLVLVVTGFDYKKRKITYCVEEFREVSKQMMNTHFAHSVANGLAGRVEFLPVVWSRDRLLDDMTDVDRMLKTVTLNSIGKLRRFTNDTLTELAFYSSPSHAQKAVLLLTESMNRVYSTFKSRYAGFAGGVSIVGHGVGSVIVYDILANQKEEASALEDASKMLMFDQPHLLARSGMEQTNRDGGNLKRSCNNSSASLVSLAESDIAKDKQSNLEEVLEKLGLREYEEKFKSEQVDVASLVLLEDSDIKEIGLPLGPRKKLQEYIKSQKNVQRADNGTEKLQQQPQQQVQIQKTLQHQFQQQNHSAKDDSECTQPQPGSSHATFTFSVERRGGSSFGGVDTLVVKHRPLEFRVENFFALGSPVALVLTTRAAALLGEEFCLPTCPGYYNIFHPFDPLAYRMEPLVLPSVPQKAVLIPHHKGRKRLHLELKENLARIGSDIKQRIMESLRLTWRTINNFTTGYRGTAISPEPKINDEDVDREVADVLTEMQKDADDAGSVVASSVADDSDFPVGSLNQGRRVDYVLQEKPIEIFNDYLFALASSSCYWQSEDTALMLLKEIYLPLGVFPQKPGLPPHPYQSGHPIGPPPKSGFIQSSAISKSQSLPTRPPQFVPLSAAPPTTDLTQPPAYSPPNWPAHDNRSFSIGPPPTSPLYPQFPPPPTMTQQNFMPGNFANYAPPTVGVNQQSRPQAALSHEYMRPPNRPIGIPPPRNDLINLD